MLNLSPICSPCVPNPGCGVLGLCQALQGIFPTTDASLYQEPNSRLWTLRHGRFHKLPTITREVRDGAEPGSGLNLLRLLSLCLFPKSWLQVPVHRTLSWPFLHRVVSLKTAWLRPCLAEAGSTRLLRPGVAGENLRLGENCAHSTKNYFP